MSWHKNNRRTCCLPTQVLVRPIWKIGVWLWAISAAEENVEVEENLVMKSIGAEHTFEVDEQDWPAIDGQMLTLVDSVHKRLLEEKRTHRTVTLKIRFRLRDDTEPQRNDFPHQAKER